jgi:hypothetical protein
MSQINPFIGSILQSTHVQRQQAAERDRQIRRIQDLEKNAALESDKLEHQVESSEGVSAIQDEESTNPRRKRRGAARHATEQQCDDQDDPHLDITA